MIKYLQEDDMIFEVEIIKWLQEHRSSFLDKLFELITMFGEEMIMILVLGLVYWSIKKDAGKRLAIIVFISMGINSLLKVMISRLRPFQVDSSIVNLRPETSQSYSMPSGHTQSSSTLFFGLASLFKKKSLWVFAITITVLVGISRMYIGVHYLSDVIVGGLLGLFMGIFLNIWLQKIKNLSKIYKILSLISIIILIIMIAIQVVKNISGISFYNELESISKMLGTLFGFGIGVLFEEKYVQFDNHHNHMKNIIRFILGIAIILVFRIGLKALFGYVVNPEGLEETLFPAMIAVLLDFIRYALMVFIGLGVYPILIKKLNI
jgi:membrane-associated phospholipid phosphatase